MGTRGLKVWRYCKRYHAEYNRMNSYPEGLGKQLVGMVPTDPKEYRRWLEGWRVTTNEWDDLYEPFLSVNTDTKILVELLDHMRDEYHPIFFAPLNDLWIEWVYTFDLEKEIFTVDNGAHFKLDKIPRNDTWIEALADGLLGDKIVVPGRVPVESLKPFSRGIV